MSNTTHTGRTTRHTIVFCKECKKTFELGDGPTPCPHCGTVRTRSSQPNYLELQARIYGTDAVPKFNLGLGCHTTGKSDYARKADQRKLFPSG